MKKTYFVGDMLNNTGPAIVNKNYYPYLKDEMYFCFTNNKILRTIHFMIIIFFVKNVIISGYSKLNIVLLKIAKKLNKNTFYLMHGFIKEEIKYQDVNNKEERIQSEYELLNNVNTIICVSRNFSNHLKIVYKEFANKITFINNGVDINMNKCRTKHDKYTIISVGGGMRRKNNLSVCKAVEKIHLDIKFLIIGKQLEDGEYIKKFPFVEYYETLSHEKVLEKMRLSDLYIQNSYFETFGLAVMEALECGCDLLISKNIGALSILENIKDDDIINNVEDENEIGLKIKNKILSNNCYINYNKEKCSNKVRVKELLKIIKSY